MKNELAAHELAVEIDRLAYILDPYEYWDVIGGRDDECIIASVRGIETDLLAGNTDPYLNWLADMASSELNSTRDRVRAAARLARLQAFCNASAELN